MTEQNDRTAIPAGNEAPIPSVELPTIRSEEDIPFDINNEHQVATKGKLSDVDSLDDQITKFKYLTGREVLYVSMGAMGIAVVISIILSFFGIENPLVENSFEVFKLIAMTVLGYIFGSKNK